MHKTDSPEDYESGYVTCTATSVLDAAQARREREDEPERKKGLNPQRARQWMTWTADEGPPQF